jgi:ABC-type nickel/cobalt efflux system permease component RcnA
MCKKPWTGFFLLRALEPGDFESRRANAKTMHVTQQGLLVIAVVVVGVLHTIVPDHWAPIALLARQHGWTQRRTAGTAALAGLGHTISTLIIAAAVWAAGALLALRFGRLLSFASSAALIALGGWIAASSWREIRDRRGRNHAHFGHAHVHRHAGGLEHRHWHEHHAGDRHAIAGPLALSPEHEHEHKTSSRTALLLILGSSPMVEGIPAFFAAGRYGAPLLVIMAVLFAVSTIATYVVLCVASAAGTRRLNLGRFEEYGEVVSGAFIAAIGAAFLIWPV